MTQPTPPEHRVVWDLKDPKDVAELSAKIRASGMPEGGKLVVMKEEPKRKKRQ